jgi:hypothetical protein
LEIENKLHCLLDVVFYEDQSRKRTVNTAKNPSLVDKIALTLLKTGHVFKRGLKIKESRLGPRLYDRITEILMRLPSLKPAIN